MVRLSQREITAVVSFIRDLHVRRDHAHLVSHLLEALPRLIAAEASSFNEADPVTRSSRTWINPPELLTPARIRLWNRLMHEHPYVQFQQRSLDVRPLRVSDLVSPRGFARTGIYNDLLSPSGMEQQLVMGLPPGRFHVRGVGLYRHRRDFAERDRALLELLQAHIAQADRNAEWVTRSLDSLRMLERGIEGLGHGLVVLGSGIRIRFATTQARAWLRAYFPGRAPAPGRLPEALERWVRHELRRLGETQALPDPVQPHVVEGAGARLVARLMADRREPLIILHEHRPGATAASLRRLGLSPRETEILAWVIAGKTNPEIATILGLSARTVQSHLERILQKLGVENRTAAAALALDIARSS